MERSQVIDNIRQVAASVLPKGSTVYLDDAVFEQEIAKILEQ